MTVIFQKERLRYYVTSWTEEIALVNSWTPTLLDISRIRNYFIFDYRGPENKFSSNFDNAHIFLGFDAYSRFLGIVHNHKWKECFSLYYEMDI